MTGPGHAYQVPGDTETFADWIEIEDWLSPAKDAARLLTIAGRTGARAAVLDDYRIEEAYQRVLRAGGLRWLQFEDQDDRETWADIVVNARPGATEVRYVSRNGSTQFLLGPRYAVLRPQFAAAAPDRSGSTVRTVLLAFGGGDDRGATPLALSRLLSLDLPKIRFKVISGKHNPNNLELRSWIAAKGAGRVDLLIDPIDIATVMTTADIAVMAGGTMTFEAASRGLPMILISIADNQVAQAEGWTRGGAAIYLGPLNPDTLERLPGALKECLAGGRRTLMGKRAVALVDGHGGARVATRLCGLAMRR